MNKYSVYQTLNYLPISAWNAMLPTFCKFNPAQKIIFELKKVRCSRYRMTCRRRSQRRLKACAFAGGEQFKH